MNHRANNTSHMNNTQHAHKQQATGTRTSQLFPFGEFGVD